MNRSYKIAMLAACPFPYPRGTPIRIYRMADALARRGHDVHVIAYHLHQAEPPAPPPAFQLHRIPVVATYQKCSPGPSLQKLLVLDPLLAMKTARLMREHAFDVIHTHHFEGLLAGLLGRAARPTPIVFDAHTLLESELPFYGLGWLKRIAASLGRAVDKRLPRFASHIIAVAPELREKLLQHGLPPEQVSVISNGVECEHFDVPALDIDDEKKTVIFTGNLAAYQGIELMLEAFARVYRKRTDVRLLIVSDSPFDRYEPLAARLGIRNAIALEPAVFATLPQQLARADVAVNPRTLCDGVPQKLLNYMAAGKAIVTFAGSAKAVTHNRRGWVVPDDDVHAFAAGIELLLQNPGLAQRLGQNAKRFVFTEMSWNTTARRTEQVYDRLLHAQARTPRGVPETM